MSKATETKLGELHGLVADVLKAQVTQQTEEMDYDEDGNATPTGKMVYVAAPATIAVAVKFLKDNNITADIEVNTGLNSLRDELANKQKRSRLQSPSEAARAH